MRRIRELISFGFLIASGIGASSCASYTDEVKAMNSAFRVGNYAAALETFEKSDVKEQSRNRMLYLLEKGMIQDRMGKREASRSLWMAADKVGDELFTTSVSKEAASYIYNEGAQAYPGEDYEKVAIHTMLAHSFLDDADLASARVEAARINTKLSEINGFYKDNKNKYRDDAYARYLSGLIFEANGEVDSAIVDYRNALKVYEGDYTENFSVSPPKELVRALYHLLLRRDRQNDARQLAGKYKALKIDESPETASIVVVHEVGVINEKREEGFVIPLGNSVVRFSFPTIKKEGLARRTTGFRLNEGVFEPGELAQNFNSIAFVNLEERRLRTIAKSMARLILKNQMTQQAEKELGAIGWLAGNIYGAVTETADTRQWTTLPAAIYVTRMTVKPGEYSLEITNNGKVKDIRKVILKRGDVQIIRDAGS